MQLILDAACLAEVVLQHGDLLVALRALLLQFVLERQFWTGWRPTARTDRLFLPHLDPGWSINIIHFSALPSFSSSCGGGWGVWPTSRARSCETISWISSECVWPTSAVTAATQLQPNTEHTALESEHTADIYPHSWMYFAFFCVFLSENMSGFLTCPVKYEHFWRFLFLKYVRQCYSFATLSDWHLQHELVIIHGRFF